MPAYVIAMLEVTDPATYERYKAASPPTIAAAGGRYVARAAEVAALEGAHDGRRVVILEFPSIQAAKGWYDGEAYRARPRPHVGETARSVHWTAGMQGNGRIADSSTHGCKQAGQLDAPFPGKGGRG